MVHYEASHHLAGGQFHDTSIKSVCHKKQTSEDDVAMARTSNFGRSGVGIRLSDYDSGPRLALRGPCKIECLGRRKICTCKRIAKVMHRGR